VCARERITDDGTESTGVRERIGNPHGVALLTMTERGHLARMGGSWFPDGDDPNCAVASRHFDAISDTASAGEDRPARHQIVECAPATLDADFPRVLAPFTNRTAATDRGVMRSNNARRR
jgi:hypothetical protein